MVQCAGQSQVGHPLRLARLKCNQLVNPGYSGNQAISEIDIDPQGQMVHLKEYHRPLK
ncbi:MAG TPA: hypothetical protein V6D19_09715 [Stenomitos sp.]